jgi:hypothetical protein
MQKCRNARMQESDANILGCEDAGMQEGKDATMQETRDAVMQGCSQTRGL